WAADIHSAASVHGHGAGGAGARERGAVFDRHAARSGDRAVNLQRAALDGGGAGKGIGAAERQCAGADLDQRRAVANSSFTAIEDAASDPGGEIIAADGELVAAEEIVAGAGDRAGADLVVAQHTGCLGEIDKTAHVGNELGV